MLSILSSTIAFLVAAFFIKRQLENMDVPKGMTRNALIFSLALAVAYGVALIVDWAAAH